MLRSFKGTVTFDGTTRDFDVEARDEYSARLLVIDDIDPFADRADDDFAFAFAYDNA